jgi:hypothetical protein
MKFIPALAILFSLVACRTNESPEAQVDDLQITTEVKAKLASDIGVSSVTNISVNSSDIKTKAAAIARALPKVTRVVDNLQVVVKPTSELLAPHHAPSGISVSGICIARTTA